MSATRNGCDLLWDVAHRYENVSSSSTWGALGTFNWRLCRFKSNQIKSMDILWSSYEACKIRVRMRFVGWIREINREPTYMDDQNRCTIDCGTHIEIQRWSMSVRGSNWVTPSPNHIPSPQRVGGMNHHKELRVRSEPVYEVSAPEGDMMALKIASMLHICPTHKTEQVTHKILCLA